MGVSGCCCFLTLLLVFGLIVIAPMMLRKMGGSSTKMGGSSIHPIETEVLQITGKELCHLRKAFIGSTFKWPKEQWGKETFENVCEIVPGLKTSDELGKKLRQLKVREGAVNKAKKSFDTLMGAVSESGGDEKKFFDLKQVATKYPSASDLPRLQTSLNDKEFAFVDQGDQKAVLGEGITNLLDVHLDGLQPPKNESDHQQIRKIFKDKMKKLARYVQPSAEVVSKAEEGVSKLVQRNPENVLFLHALSRDSGYDVNGIKMAKFHRDRLQGFPATSMFRTLPGSFLGFLESLERKTADEAFVKSEEDEDINGREEKNRVITKWLHKNLFEKLGNNKAAFLEFWEKLFGKKSNMKKLLVNDKIKIFNIWAPKYGNDWDLSMYPDDLNSIHVNEGALNTQHGDADPINLVVDSTQGNADKGNSLVVSNRALKLFYSDSVAHGIVIRNGKGQSDENIQIRTSQELRFFVTPDDLELPPNYELRCALKAFHGIQNDNEKISTVRATFTDCLKAPAA